MFPAIVRKDRRKKNYKIIRDRILELYPGLTENELKRKWKILGVTVVVCLLVNKRLNRTAIALRRGSKSKTPTLARHLMELKEERSLETWEHVDHIDEDKTNDHIDNLQILTGPENAKKHHAHKRKYDQWCKYSCVISGVPIRRLSSRVRKDWTSPRGTGATSSISHGHLLGWIRKSRALQNQFLTLNFSCVAGRFFAGSATETDLKRLRKNKIMIPNEIQVREEKVRKRFDRLVEKHTPHLKTSKDLSPARLQFLYARWRDFGREDWFSFYRPFLLGMVKMPDKRRLEFIFREVYAFDQGHGSEMAWRLFNVF